MNLKAYRDKKKLTSAEMGRLIGVTHSTVLRYESGEVYPSGAMLLRIQTVTGGKVRPADFFPAVKSKQEGELI